jgi:PIN domain nuclease of toxin-antitoxin system
VLLDTHVLLWYVLDDARLSDTARQLIQDADSEVLVSPASFWEIAIKVSIGKLTLHASFQDFFALCFDRYGFVLLSIEPAHIARVAVLPFPGPHKDPFDRLLVAQALVEGLTLISADDALDVYAARRLW